jgi:hypothetical protein
MMSSPYVGEDARRMQSQLDREGKGANPDDYLKRLDALGYGAPRGRGEGKPAGIPIRPEERGTACRRHQATASR